MAVGRAETDIIHVRKQTAMAEDRIVGPDGKLYAHVTATFLICNNQLIGSNERKDSFYSTCF